MEISPSDIINDKKFQNFIKSRELRESTELLYARRLTDFCNFIDKDPTELIEEALEEYNQKSGSQKVSNYIDHYLDELRDNGKSKNTIKNRYDTLKAFFSGFEIDTSTIKHIKGFKNENLVPEELPGRGHIKKAIQVSGIRDKAILLLHFSSGMGAIELRNLTYRDFIGSVDEYLDLNDEEKLNVPKVVSELNKNEIVGTWQIMKLKSGIPYITFNSPESTKAIMDYLMDRERNNKPIETFDDPLFVNTWNKPLAKSVHGAIFKRINDKAGFGHLEGKRRFITSGTLRKSFEKTLNEADVDAITIDCFLGYKVDVNGSEFMDIGAMKDQYIGALEFLSLDNHNQGTNPEFEMLMEKFNEKDQELKQIKEHIKYLEEKMKSITPDRNQS